MLMDPTEDQTNEGRFITDQGRDSSAACSSDESLPELSDAGKYSYASLVASILAQLFDEDFSREFRCTIIKDLMIALKLPDQSHKPLMAVADSEMKVRPEPLIDNLLEEKLTCDDPTCILSTLLLVSIKSGNYDARARVLIEHLSWMLRVQISTVESVEEDMLNLLKLQAETTEEEKKEAEKRSRKNKIKRGLLIGLATVVGGTVIGVTGGLAAPLIASGLGVFIGATGGAALGSIAGVAVIGSLFGVAGAGLTGYKMKKRVGNVEQFEFGVLSESSQMSVTIAISGWVSKGQEDFRSPWETLDNSKEQYFLRYEGHYLEELGQSLDTLSSLVVKSAITETLKYTALNAILSAMAWPATLLSLASVIDNPWHVCTKRAENIGKHLAEVLINRQQGHRPVTLIGFSLGARVIFYALRELAKHPKGQGIVESAYLMGAPVTGNPSDWEPFSRVVAGQIVNAYIRNDWLLKFLYRTASVQFSIAGTAPVKWDNRRMINMDLTNVVNGHMDYMRKMTIVLQAIGIKTRTLPPTCGLVAHAAGVNKESKLPRNSASASSIDLISSKSYDIVSVTSSGAEDKLEEGIPKSELVYERLTQQGNHCDGSPQPMDISTDSEESLVHTLPFERLLEMGSDGSVNVVNGTFISDNNRLPSRFLERSQIDSESERHLAMHDSHLLSEESCNSLAYEPPIKDDHATCGNDVNSTLAAAAADGCSDTAITITQHAEHVVESRTSDGILCYVNDACSPDA